jgi:hypothetical protein
LNCATSSKALIATFMLWFCSALWRWDINILWHLEPLLSGDSVNSGPQHTRTQLYNNQVMKPVSKQRLVNTYSR